VHTCGEMPPKKKGSAADDGDAIENLISNYKRACTLIGAEEIKELVIKLSGEDDDEDSDDCLDSSVHLVLQDLPLRPCGTRAFAWACLGNGEGMNQKAYTKYESITFCRCDCQDAGAVALAEVLRLGKSLDVVPSALSFIHCGIRQHGCAMLGSALEHGANNTLKSLTLDYNVFGNDGFSALVYGLRSNTCLESLNVRFCGMAGTDFGATLCDLLSGEQSKLRRLNVEGNRIGPMGLAVLSRCLKRNKTLVALDISDNGIDISYEPKEFKAYSEGLGHFCTALQLNSTLLELNFRFNTLGAEGATLLRPALDKSEENPNKTLKKVFVSSILGKEDFDSLNRNEPIKGGKGKKKGKKKK